MARVSLVIVAAIALVALPPATSVARSPKRESTCKDVCDQARVSAALNGQQRRLLRTGVAAGTCAPSSNSLKDVESKPNVKTFEPYPCKFFMC
jgi:hypothetical protein